LLGWSRQPKHAVVSRNIYFQLRTAVFFKAYCANRVRRSNFRHQASPRVTTREHPAVEGGTVGEKCPRILPKCRRTRYILGSFTCRKATKWDRRLYFPSEGRRAKDFFREPANLGTKGQHATSRPPKPLIK